MPPKQDFQVYVTDDIAYQKILNDSANDTALYVIDVHSTWCGNCKAIVPTFQRLYYEASDKNPIKFIVADAEKILSSAKNNTKENGDEDEEEKLKDTHRDRWTKVLKKYAGKSRPVFLFYKNGWLRDEIVGVETPLITKFIKQYSTETEEEMQASIRRMREDRIIEEHNNEVNKLEEELEDDNAAAETVVQEAEAVLEPVPEQEPEREPEKEQPEAQAVVEVQLEAEATVEPQETEVEVQQEAEVIEQAAPQEAGTEAELSQEAAVEEVVAAAEESAQEEGKEDSSVSIEAAVEATEQ